MLEDEQKSVIAAGCPTQITLTNVYRSRFKALLDPIDALNHQLGKAPTQKVQALRARFIGDNASETVPDPTPSDPKTERAQLKAHTAALNALEKEYLSAFKTVADPEWEREIKADYKEKMDALKEEWADQNAEDIREWIRENKNDPTFMAIAERIGYDATGREDPINDLDMICDEYQRFCNEGPDFFG